MVRTHAGELLELEDEELDAPVRPREPVAARAPSPPPTATPQVSETRHLAAPEGGPEPFDFDDQMLSAIDESFDAIVLPTGSAAPVEPDGGAARHGLESGAQVEEVRLLFSQICEGHVQPLLDFVCDLQAGRAVDHTVRDVRAAARTLLRMATGVGMHALARALSTFVSELEVFDDPTSGVPLAVRTQNLVAAYHHLRGELPDVFSAPASRDDRELLVVGALFSQLPAIGGVAIDKLFSAGLGKIRVLASAHPEELAVVTGLTVTAAQAVVERFAAHRDELDRDPASFTNGARLAHWVRELGTVTDAYEEARASWSERSRIDRRVLRKLRTDAFAEVTIALVYMGQLELVYGLTRLPFVEKVRALEAHLTRR